MELRIITTGTSYELLINRGGEVGEQVEKKPKEKKKKKIRDCHVHVITWVEFVY